jgi:hypothetical protein
MSIRLGWFWSRYGSITSVRINLVAHRYKAFTGEAPFPGIAPITVAVGIISGKRPPRPMHLGLTDGLWEITERCWDQDPQRRPEISEVIICVQSAIALRRDHADTDDKHTDGNQVVADDTTSENVPRERVAPGEFYFLALQEVILSMIERTTLPTVPLDTNFSHASTDLRARRTIPRPSTHF